MSEPGDDPGLSDLLTARHVQLLNQKWNDDGSWADVAGLAARFWTTSPGDDRSIAWHHLVLAVGNFKRQGGRLYPAPLPQTVSDWDPSSAPKKVRVPWDENQMKTIDRADRDTWEGLLGVRGGMKGLGVATTTTLLAALWPQRHFVFDRRVIAAAHGLRLAAGKPGLPAPGTDPATTKGLETTFDAYETVRRWLISTVDRLWKLTKRVHVEYDRTSEKERTGLTQIERSLYQLDVEATKDKDAAEDRTWTQYGEELKRRLD